jgi:hypothetical protein
VRPAPFRFRRALATLLVLALATRGSHAQEPRQPRQHPPDRGPESSTPQPPAFAGSFEGSATLSNDDPAAACRYEGTPGTPSVHLEFGGGKTVAGSIAIDMPAPAGATGCPPLRKRYAISELTHAGQTIAFTDSGGNEWTLAQRDGGKTLQGLLAWSQGAVEEPLAEGFTLPGGRRPAARLSGEVTLHRVVAGGAGAAAATPAHVGAGKQAGHLGAIIGANVVGLGLLYGVNKLGKGSSETGAVTCSPRICIVGTPGAPCFCEGNVLSGASCGTTEAGAPIGAPCDGHAVPCQQALSCNSGICEDRDGRCPY